MAFPRAPLFGSFAVVALVGAAACVGDSDNGAASSSSGDATSSSSSGGATSSSGAATSSSSSSSGEPDAALTEDADADAAAETDASDAGPTGPTPPLPEPDVWLDARLLPDVASINTWSDSSTHGADGIAASPHPVNRPILGNGIPSVTFSSTAFTPFLVSEAKIPPMRPADGFTVILVAAYQNTATRTSQAYLLHRTHSSGGIGPNFTGLELYLTGANPGPPVVPLTNTAALLFASAQRATPTGNLVGTIPPAESRHVYVLHVRNGAAKLRVDGAQIASDGATGSYALSDTIPLRIGNNAITGSQFAFVGGISLVAYYGRELTPTDVTAAETKTKADFGIP